MIWLELSVGTFVVLFIHEIGHLLIARLLSIRVLGISIGLGPTLFAFEDRWKTRWNLCVLPLRGNVAVWDDDAAAGRRTHSDALSDKTLNQQAAFYLAGPAFSLLLGLLLVEVVIFWPNDPILQLRNANDGLTIGLLLGDLSIVIGLFNLLPLPPLDGGKLLLLWIQTRRPLSDRAQTLLSRVGMMLINIVTVGLVVAGVWLSFNI
jgi:membrane-associated protease RseP (regulator of RpoE activity)